MEIIFLTNQILLWFSLTYPQPRGSNLTHWGRVTHICVGNLTIIGSDNGWSPGRRRAITWINVGILLIGPLGTNFSEMLIEIHTFSFKKIHLKMSSGKWRPFCLGLNVLIWKCLSTSVIIPIVEIIPGVPNRSNGDSYYDKMTSLYHWKPRVVMTYDRGCHNNNCWCC